MTLVELIFAHARAAPGRTAMIHDGAAISYGEFAAEIAAARGILVAEAPPPDRPAVVCAADLRRAWILGLAARSLGLTTVIGREPGDLDRLGLGALSVVTSRAEAWPGLVEAAAARGDRLIELPAKPEATAARLDKPFATPGGHILLTSGTTGAYKKVLIDATVEAWNRRVRAEVYGLSRDSVVDVFDFGGWTSVGHQLPAAVWGLGGAVVTHQGPERWRSLAAPGLTLAYTQPQLLADLLAAPEDVDLRHDRMSLIVTSGALPVSLWREARERLTRDVRTCIGSTEAGVVTITPIETPDDLVWHRIHPTARVEVVDESGRRSAPGESGAVRMRAFGVDGYLGDPATSQAFFRDGWFYPGDLGVIREDGRLALQGRITDVINLMGDKIATLPIETAIQDALGARAVCVFSAPGPDGEGVHVAIQPGGPIAPEALRAALIAALPGVAQVRAHAVADMPRNATGKIDRAALKAMLLGG